jgi:TonB family protein
MANAQELEMPPPPVVEPPVEEIYDFSEEPAYLKLDSCASISNQEKLNCSNAALMQYLKSNVRYSAADILAGYEGIVYVSMVINKSGKLEDFRILRNKTGSTHFEYEAKRLLHQLNQEMSWEPAKVRGQTVKMRMNIPVRFRLP